MDSSKLGERTQQDSIKDHRKEIYSFISKNSSEQVAILDELKETNPEDVGRNPHKTIVFILTKETPSTETNKRTNNFKRRIFTKNIKLNCILLSKASSYI